MCTAGIGGVGVKLYYKDYLARDPIEGKAWVVGVCYMI